VKEVVEHNKNSDASFKKGINEFSDMSDEEFFDHFKFVSDPQHCSATNYNMKVEKSFAL